MNNEEEQLGTENIGCGKKVHGRETDEDSWSIKGRVVERGGAVIIVVVGFEEELCEDCRRHCNTVEHVERQDYVDCDGRYARRGGCGSGGWMPAKRRMGGGGMI